MPKNPDAGQAQSRSGETLNDATKKMQKNPKLAARLPDRVPKRADAGDGEEEVDAEGDGDYAPDADGTEANGLLDSGISSLWNETVDEDDFLWTFLRCPRRCGSLRSPAHG